MTELKSFKEYLAEEMIEIAYQEGKSSSWKKKKFKTQKELESWVEKNVGKISNLRQMGEGVELDEAYHQPMVYTIMVAKEEAMKSEKILKKLGLEIKKMPANSKEVTFRVFNVDKLEIENACQELANSDINCRYAPK